jgi:hypothetical protein
LISRKKKGRKIKAPADHPYAEAIQAGIDNALAEHLAFMLRYGTDLPGAERLHA